MDYSDISINKDATILQTLQRMDMVRHKMLLVFDSGKFFSIVTIGEIQRAIISHAEMTTPIYKIINLEDKTYAYDSDSVNDIKDLMLRIRAEFMPVLNRKGDIVKVYRWADFFESTRLFTLGKQVNIPVVIMAGGKGTRLKPITNVIPKPLVPVGDCTILEEIMNQYESIGCKKFFISVNYKSEIIKYYINQLDHKYDVEFFEEDKPLGTIGSVSLLKGKVTTPFFVSNCDIIIDQDYRDVYDYHIENQDDLTIVTALKTFSIPYGVIETGKDGLMKDLQEKPELTYMINTGVYILNPECIDEIPVGTHFHITQLMEKVKERGGRIGCFPVSEHSWRDMGEWSEYLKMIKVF